MKNKSAPCFHRPAKLYADMFGSRRAFHVKLLQQVGKRYLPGVLVDDQSERPVRRMGAHVNYGSTETRVIHIGHGYQQLARQ